VSEGFGGKIPSVLAQGDFCGENILGDGERYGVIDWELCDEPSIPTYDIVDLCLWVAFRTEGHLEPDPFAALERLLPSATQHPTSIHQAMRHSVFAGGKRLRPILCMEAGRMIAGSLPDGIEELGAALETSLRQITHPVEVFEREWRRFEVAS